MIKPSARITGLPVCVALLLACLTFAVMADSVAPALTISDPATTGNVGQSDIDRTLIRDFENRFHHLMGDANIPGGAFVIVTPDTIAGLGTKGHTVVGGSDAVTANTVFRLASVSKTFAAELTALLVEQGKLTWQDSATRYVPNFRINGNANRITLADLLGQSTGIVGHAYDHLIEEGQRIEQILPKFAVLKPVCSPSTCYTYQNVAFSLIEPAIQSVSNASYADNLDTNIFQPLGMRTASVGLDNLLNSDSYAHPHRKRGSSWREVPVLPTYYRINPAAGVNASILDMARWLQAQLGAHPTVISDNVVASVTSPRLSTRGDLRRKFWSDHLTEAHYGLGWRVYRWGEELLIYHGGWVSGFRADIAFSPEHNVGFALLTNAEGSTVSEITTTFWELFFSQVDKNSGLSLNTP